VKTGVETMGEQTKSMVLLNYTMSHDSIGGFIDAGGLVVEEWRDFCQLSQGGWSLVPE
jgi:hypothetical protein